MFRNKFSRIALVLTVTVLAALAATVFVTAANSTPVTAADDCQMFPETGFSVCGRFLTYWREHGGLEQQGYPISNVFEEQNQPPPAGDGKIHRVQYFQRARFEEHTENQPPYDVLLGLLGAEQLEARKNPTTVPAQPTPTPTAAPPTQAPTSNTLTIRGYRFQNAIGSSQPKSGFRYLIVDVLLVNTSSAEVSSNILFFTVTTDKLYDYEGDFDTFGLDKKMNLKTLQPGDTAGGEIAFQVPVDENPKTLTFDSYELKAKVNF